MVPFVHQKRQNLFTDPEGITTANQEENMKLLPEIALDMYEAQIDLHHELRLGPDQVHAIFNMARAYLGTTEGKMAMQQRSLPLRPAKDARPEIRRIVLAA